MIENQATSQRNEVVHRTPEYTVMYRPVGPAELEKLATADFRAWPPRLPEQPIFYPVTNERYATQIARDWNVPDSGCGFVTRFKVANEFADKYSVQRVGHKHHTEWWIPAEDVADLNSNLVGCIEVIGVHGSAAKYSALLDKANTLIHQSYLSCPLQRYQINMEWSQASVELPYLKTSHELECQVRIPKPDGSFNDFLISLMVPMNSSLAASSQVILIPFSPLPDELVRPGTRLPVYLGKDTFLGEATVA